MLELPPQFSSPFEKGDSGHLRTRKGGDSWLNLASLWIYALEPFALLSLWVSCSIGRISVGFFFSSFRKTWCPSERLSRWPGYWCASAPIQRQKSMCAPHLLTIRPAHQEETTVGGNVERRKAKRTEKQRRQSYCCNTHSLVAGRDENVHTVTECRVGGEQSICGKQTKKRYTRLKFWLKMKPKKTPANKNKWQKCCFLETRRNKSHGKR